MSRRDLQEEELIKQAQQGDREAKAELIEENEGLIYQLAHKLKNAAYDVEELFQVGAIGMLKAIDKYNFEQEAKLTTFATYYILGEMKMFLRDNSSIKLSRKLKSDYKRVKDIQQSLNNKLKREATIGEISQESGLTKEEIVKIIEINKQPVSINNSENGVNFKLVNKLASRDKSLENRLNSLLLKDIIKKLRPRERLILRLRYSEAKSQAEIGRELNISQAHVSRLEKKVLTRIKRILKLKSDA